MRWSSLFVLSILVKAGAQTDAPATVVSPTPGTALAGPSVAFNWTAPTGATSYRLRLGTTAGSNNLYGSGTVAINSVTANNLPTHGETVYATLFTAYGMEQVSTEYVFTAATQAALISPTAAELTGTTVTFNWTTAAGAIGYRLRLGTTQGANDLYGSGPITATNATATKLPTNGGLIFARLYTQYASTKNYSEYSDYLFTAAVATVYNVELSWDAPAEESDPVVGYNVYRSPIDASMYQLLNASVDIETTYVDRTVLDGVSYDYVVESVDAEGVESVPTSAVPVTIP